MGMSGQKKFFSYDGRKGINGFLIPAGCRAGCCIGRAGWTARFICSFSLYTEIFPLADLRLNIVSGSDLRVFVPIADTLLNG